MLPWRCARPKADLGLGLQVGFSRAIEAAALFDLDVPLMVDYHSTHEHPKIKASVEI